MAKVSIVVPIYNVEKYLDRCIQSLVNQSLRDIEIIMVDDGSPDHCPQMCDEWAKRDSRIKVVHKKNAGLGMACNSGIEVITGRYVAFVDSDDWVDTKMYATMIEAAESHNAQMVFTGLRRVDNTGKGYHMAQSSKLKIYDNKNNIEDFALGMIASAPDIASERQVMMSAKVVLYNRQMIIDNCLKFESERRIISEDLFFNLDCLRMAHCVVELPQTFYNYFVNSQSLSQSYRSDRFGKTLFMYHELLNRYGNRSEKFNQRADRMLIGYTRTILRQLIQCTQLTTRKKRKEYKKIANDPIWARLSNRYPIQSMPKMHQIIFQSLVFQQFFPIWIIYSIEKLIKGID